MNWLTRLGVQEKNADENQLTILYNIMALFSVIFLLLFAVYLFLTDVPRMFVYITLCTSVVYALILVLNGFNKIYLARLCCSLGTVTWVSIYHICFGGFISQSLAVGAGIIINYVAFRKKAEYMRLLISVHAGIYLMALLYGIYNEPVVELIYYPIAGLISFVVSMAWVMLILIAFHRDREDLINRLKHKNHELENTTNELERFSYIASHDLKSPLRTIISFSNLVQKELKNGNIADIDDKMNYVISGAQQMNYIVEGILELSKIKSFDKTDRTEIDLNKVLGKIKLNLKEEITERNARIISDDLPTFLGNEIEFLLLFQNFVQNGIKYNESEQPIIRIKTLQKNNQLQISFEDNGIGIEQKYFDQIFEFFKRLHNVSEYPGTGIGLGICKRIIDNYDGDIHVESTVGLGTIFTICLPIGNHAIIHHDNKLKPTLAKN